MPRFADPMILTPERKRIAVVGTGASSVQIVPGFAGDPEQPHVFQRTALWVLPRNDRAYSELEKQLFEWVPGFQKAYRAFLEEISFNMITV